MIPIFKFTKGGVTWAADINGQLLKFAHGTGDVKKQLFQIKTMHGQITNLETESFEESDCATFIRGTLRKRDRKTGEKLSNCTIIGSHSKLREENLSKCAMAQIFSKLSIDLSTLWQCDRIIKKGTVFYTKNYSRMSRRVCFVCLLSDDRISPILKFVWNQENRISHDVVSLMKVKPRSKLLYKYGKHLVEVADEGKYDLVPVDQIQEKLVFLTVRSDNTSLVIQNPNKYGHGVIN